MKKLKHKIKEIYIVWSAKQIMKEVNADKTLKKEDIYIPEETKDKIMAAIHDIEVRDQERKEKARLAEEQELIRLGRRYKKGLQRRKYILLAAVLVLALSFSINCFGSVDKMFHKLDLKIFNREREVVDTDGVMQLEHITEEEAFAKIEEQYGFYPVRLVYRPKNTRFIEMNIFQDIPKINILYGTKDCIQIICDILPNYRECSITKDIEDSLVNKYKMTNERIEINVSEYLVNGNETRWLLQFEYKDFYYWIYVFGVEENEIIRIVENMYFS